MAHLHLSYYLSSPPGSDDPVSNDPGSRDCPAAVSGGSSNCSNNTVHLSPLGNLPTYISMVSCSLSCLGSLLIFVAYFSLKGIRNVAQKIITLLALADFFTATGYLIAGWNQLSNVDSCPTFITVCKVQSFITSWSSICSFGWTSSLALHFFLLLAKRRLPLSAILVWQNLVIWVFPLLIVLPLLITGHLGYSHYAVSNWCFIKQNPSNQLEVALILIGGKLWEILSYVFVVVMYSITTSKINKHAAVRQEQVPSTPDQDPHTPPPQEGSRADVKQRLLMIPLLFILLRMWGTIQFFYSLTQSKFIESQCVSRSTNTALKMLGIMQAIGDGGQGWGNALLYIFLSPVIRQQLFVYPFSRCLLFCLERLQLASDRRRTGEEEEVVVRRGRQQQWREDTKGFPPTRKAGRGAGQGLLGDRERLLSGTDFDSEGLRSVVDSRVYS